LANVIPGMTRANDLPNDPPKWRVESGAFDLKSLINKALRP